MKPIDGMKNDVDGLPLMFPAWYGCVLWAADKKEFVDAFKDETGYNLEAVLRASNLDALIDEATGYSKAVVVAWADWVTENLWGKLTDD